MTKTQEYNLWAQLAEALGLNYRGDGRYRGDCKFCGFPRLCAINANKNYMASLCCDLDCRNIIEAAAKAATLLPKTS